MPEWHVDLSSVELQLIIILIFCYFFVNGSIDALVYEKSKQSDKCQKSKVMFLNFLFCLTNITKSKDIKFTTTEHKEK